MLEQPRADLWGFLDTATGHCYKVEHAEFLWGSALYTEGKRPAGLVPLLIGEEVRLHGGYYQRLVRADGKEFRDNA